MHLCWPHNTGEKGIRWESWAIRSLYLGSNARKIHCTQVWEGEAKRRTISQETCLIAVRWKLPCKVWNPCSPGWGYMFPLFMWRRNFLWNSAERKTPEVIELCMIKWQTVLPVSKCCPVYPIRFPATNGTYTSSAGQRIRDKTGRNAGNFILFLISEKKRSLSSSSFCTEALSVFRSG